MGLPGTKLNGSFLFKLEIHRSNEAGLEHPWHNKYCSEDELTNKQFTDCSATLYSHIASTYSLFGYYKKRPLVLLDASL